MIEGIRANQLPRQMRPDAIGRRLWVLRTSFGLSKAEFADSLDIDRTHWGRFENGQRVIPVEKASRIVDRYFVTLDHIFLGHIATLRHDILNRLREIDKTLE